MKKNIYSENGNVVGFQKVLQEVDDKAQAALDASAKYQEAEMKVTTAE